MPDLAATPDTPTDDPRRALLDDDRLTAAGLLFEVANGLLSHLSSQITAAGIALSEFEVLLRLSRSPDSRLRMTDLAVQANLSTSGLTRLVDRIESRGLVERQACPSDRRGSYAALTPTGQELLLSVIPGHVELIDTWFTGTLDARQLPQLTTALRTVRAVVRPGAEAGVE